MTPNKTPPAFGCPNTVAIVTPTSIPAPKRPATSGHALRLGVCGKVSPTYSPSANTVKTITEARWAIQNAHVPSTGKKPRYAAQQITVIAVSVLMPVAIVRRIVQNIGGVPQVGGREQFPKPVISGTSEITHFVGRRRRQHRLRCTPLPKLLVRFDHLLGKLMQTLLVHRPCVEHVPARELMHLHPVRVTHHRHLVDREHRAHERARKIVPSMHDQH